MKKMLVLGLFFCGFMSSMQWGARAMDESRAYCIARDSLQDVYNEKKDLLVQVRQQIIAQKAYSVSDACLGSSFLCGVSGVVQQLFGYDPRAAFVTACSSLCCNIVCNHVGDTLRDVRVTLSLAELCALKKELKRELRDIYGMIEAHRKAMLQAQSLHASVFVRRRAPASDNDPA